jgi:hypothetical protein
MTLEMTFSFSLPTMSNKQAVVRIFASVMAARYMAIAAATVVSTIDGRSWRQPASRRFSSRITPWHEVEEDPSFDDGWYRENFRCNRASFDAIAQIVEDHWLELHPPLGENNVFSIRTRLAATMHYLCHAGSLSETATTFGMSKATASRCVWQVIDIINHSFTISLPTTTEEWKTLKDGFKAICGRQTEVIDSYMRYQL